MGRILLFQVSIFVFYTTDRPSARNNRQQETAGHVKQQYFSKHE